MSRAFVKDDNEDLPGEELPERPVSSAPNYVTPAGLANLRKKVEELHDEHVRLKGAEEDFDRPRLAEIERDLRYYQARLEAAVLVDVSTQPRDEVHFGASVKTRNESRCRAFHRDCRRGRSRRRPWPRQLAVPAGEGIDRCKSR